MRLSGGGSWKQGNILNSEGKQKVAKEAAKLVYIMKSCRHFSNVLLLSVFGPRTPVAYPCCGTENRAYSFLRILAFHLCMIGINWREPSTFK